MQKNFLHVLSNCMAFFLAILVLVPTFKELSHIVEEIEHHHKLCDDALQTHIHAKKVDCKISLASLDTEIDFLFLNYVCFTPKYIRTFLNNYYTFLDSYQILHFLLRGPPYIIFK